MPFSKSGPLFVLCVICLLNLSKISSADICPRVKGCSCSKDKKSHKEWGVYAKCQGTNPAIDLLPLANVTWLNLSKCTFSNVSTLWSLRKANLGYWLNIRAFSSPSFNWNWLPDTCRKVTFSNYGRRILFTSHSENEPSSSHLCAFRTNFSVSTVYITSAGYLGVPQCLPNTTSSLSLVKNPLTEIDGRNRSAMDPLRWPSHLRILNLKYGEFMNISDHVFSAAPSSLKRILITNCKRPLRHFPNTWPPSGTVEYIEIKSCGLSDITSAAFTYLPNLKILNLDRNQLRTIPSVLPNRLQKLSLNSNALTNVDNVQWHLVSNLTIIYLTGNQLRRVPARLPVGLQTLLLNRNMIEFCGQDTFIHMRKLRSLDMSFNRLLNMPVNLPSTMLSLRLDNNDIGLVRSPASYTYCANCTVINLSNNPWVCDEDMVKMLIWLGKRNLLIQLTFGSKKPCAAVENEFESDQLQNLLGYMMNTAKRFPYCLYNIKTLECKNTTATDLPAKPPASLHNVCITHLPNLKIFPSGLVKDLKNLRRLVLNYNGLVQFPRLLPSSLEVLYLIANKIQSIAAEDQDTLDNLPNLRELYLDNNLITTIYDYQLLPMKSLNYFSLVGNPLHCDCSLQSLAAWFIEKKISLDGVPKCASPSSQNQSLITQLTGAFIYRYKCAPRLCEWKKTTGILNCSRSTQLGREKVVFETLTFREGRMPIIPNSSYWRELDLCGINLTSNAVRTRQLHRLETINLTDNSLVIIPLLRLPRSLKNLILQRNDISSLPRASSMLAFLPNLELLDLCNNKLITLDQNDVKILPVINRVMLNGNPLSCDCRLRVLVTWIQTNKEKEDALIRNGFENLTCFEPLHLRGTILADLEEGDYCPRTDFTIMISCLAAGLLVLLIVLFVVNFYLHKRRISKERRDIVQGFRDLLEKEALLPDLQDPETGVAEESQYHYDAFVSYCSDGRDEDFVYMMLEELEEQRDRKICLHDRDFLPGRGIADNIAESIVLSRRVILVISRKYATSSWSQYEVQVALAQLHKRRRGRLLVPLLLEDVTNDEAYAGSVKTILSAITALHVPAPEEKARGWREFWNKLDDALK